MIVIVQDLNVKINHQLCHEMGYHLVKLKYLLITYISVIPQ